MFRSKDYPYVLKLDGLNKDQRVCLVLQRRRDKADNLSLANLISIEK